MLHRPLWPDAALQRQRAALGGLDQRAHAPLLAKLAALHELLQAAGELIQHVVYLAAALQQGAGQAGQIAPLASFQAGRKAALQHLLQRRLQLRALLRVGEQAPEGAEGLAGVAVGDQIDIGEHRVEHVAAVAVAVDDALAQIAVQAAEVVAHAPKVAGQFIAQRDDLAHALQRPVVRQRLQQTALRRLDASVDALALPQQPLHADVRIGLGLVRKLDQLRDHQSRAGSRWPPCAAPRGPGQSGSPGSPRR